MLKLSGSMLLPYNFASFLSTAILHIHIPFLRFPSLPKGVGRLIFNLKFLIFNEFLMAEFLKIKN